MRNHIEPDSITKLVTGLTASRWLVLGMKKVLVNKANAFTIHFLAEINFAIIVWIVRIARYFIALINCERCIYHLVVENSEWLIYIFICVIPIEEIVVFPIAIV